MKQDTPPKEYSGSVWNFTILKLQKSSYDTDCHPIDFPLSQMPSRLIEVHTISIYTTIVYHLLRNKSHSTSVRNLRHWSPNFGRGYHIITVGVPLGPGGHQECELKKGEYIPWFFSYGPQCFDDKFQTPHSTGQCNCDIR